MMWHDISTAPVGRMVLLGAWHRSYTKDGLVWLEEPGFARERWLLFFSRATYEGKRNSHWREAPPPPEPTQ